MNQKVIIGIVLLVVVLVAIFYTTNSQAQTPGFSAPKLVADKPGTSTIQDIAQGLNVANTLAKAVPLVGAALGIGGGAGTASIVGAASAIATPAEIGGAITAATGSTQAGAAAASAASETLAAGGTGGQAVAAGSSAAATIINIAVPVLIAAIVVSVIVNAPSFQEIDLENVDRSQGGAMGESGVSNQDTLFDSQAAINSTQGLLEQQLADI